MHASTFSLPLRRHSKTVVGEIHGWTPVRRANVIVAPYKSRLIAEEYGPVYQNYCRPCTHCNLWPVIEEGSAHPTKLLSRKYMNFAATTAGYFGVAQRSWCASPATILRSFRRQCANRHRRRQRPIPVMHK